MKKYLLKTLAFFIIVCSLALPLQSAAQDKQDIVTMLNGEKKTGKVVAINDIAIKFVYTGETLEYEIKKETINKIEFASGRVEVINDATPKHEEAAAKPATTGQTSTPEDRKNKIAVLPFEIFTNDPSLSGESMSKQVQLSCISALRDQSPFQTIQDPMLTNSILAKHNMSASNLSVNTPKEWAELLGVEYVVIGSYSIENKGTFSSGSNVTTYDSKKTDDKKSGTAVNSGSSYTSTSYDTKVGLSIYNDLGNNIYSDTRKPLFGSIDSYNPALKFLIKRTPFGKK